MNNSGIRITAVLGVGNRWGGGGIMTLSFLFWFPISLKTLSYSWKSGWMRGGILTHLTRGAEEGFRLTSTEASCGDDFWRVQQPPGRQRLTSSEGIDWTAQYSKTGSIA